MGFPGPWQHADDAQDALQHEGIVQFTEQVARDMATGWEVALSLAEEKGAAPIMTEEFEVGGSCASARK